MIAAARPARGPATPAVQRRARSLRALVVARAQRVPVQPPSDPNATLQTVVRALETAAVVAAVGAHLAAAATAVQQRQAAAPAQSRRQQQPVSEQQGSRRTAHAVAAPAAPVGFMAQPAGWASPSSLWLTLPLLAAVVLGRIRAWISGNSTPRRVTTEAAARLLRAEAAAGQQAQRIEELARQLDKLSVRSRVVGRDVKLPIQQLQAAAGQQAEALVAMAARMETLEKEIRDTEELVGAMQGVSAKQFALLLKVMEQQQAAPGAPPPRQQQQQQAATGPAAAAGRAAGPEKAASSGSTAGAQPLPAGSQQQSGSAAAAGQAASGQTDEWGRTVRPLPSPPQATPPLPSAAPARAMSAGGPLRPLGSLPTPRCSADAMAAAAAAAAAEGPLSYDGPEEQQQEQQAQQAEQRQGLNQDSLLGIMGEDSYWQAEQQIISAVVNQPKKAQKPEVEILPPLFPPAPELSPEEAALQRKRREQVEEWRLRMRRSWDMSRLEAALEASHDEDDASGAAAAAEDPSGQAQGSEQPPSSLGGDSGDAGGSRQGRQDGARWEDNGDGTTTFHFE